MVERGANIDIVFRNGLKDFEALPPPEVWDNIHPVIKRKQRSLVYLRAAALVTVVLSMSFLAYRLSKVSTESESAVIAFNIDAASPLRSSEIIRDLTDASAASEYIKIPQEQSVENIPVVPVTTDGRSFSSPVAKFKGRNGLIEYRSKSLKGPSLATLNNPLNTSFQFTEPEKQSISLSTIKKGNERWSMAAMASPTYYAKFNSASDQLSNELIASEKPLMSYTGGIGFAYKINRRLSIQSGLYYSSLGQEVGGITSYSGFQIYDNTKGDHNFEVLTSNGTVFTRNSDVFLMSNGSEERIMTSFTKDVFDPEKANLQYVSSTMRQSFSYLELPVSLKYKVIDKIIGINVIGGKSYNLLVNNSAYTVVEGSKYLIGETEGLNPVSVSSSLGMGMEYKVSENFSLNLEPTFRYYLNPFNSTVSSGIHPYSFGLFSGLSYKF
jgi:hypothetical protein